MIKWKEFPLWASKRIHACQQVSEYPHKPFSLFNIIFTQNQHSPTNKDFHQSNEFIKIVFVIRFLFLFSESVMCKSSRSVVHFHRILDKTVYWLLHIQKVQQLVVLVVLPLPLLINLENPCTWSWIWRRRSITSISISRLTESTMYTYLFVISSYRPYRHSPIIATATTILSEL